jgi:hypothetical protein
MLRIFEANSRSSEKREASDGAARKNNLQRDSIHVYSKIPAAYDNTKRCGELNLDSSHHLISLRNDTK